MSEENNIQSKVQDNSITFRETEPYELDFDKINTIDDIKGILKGLNITIYSGYESFDKLEQYLKPKDNE